MNKYLSIEEQRTFWTDLFAVTIRYEQRRRAATETYPDSAEGLRQDVARIADQSTRIAQGHVYWSEQRKHGSAVGSDLRADRRE